MTRPAARRLLAVALPAALAVAALLATAGPAAADTPEPGGGWPDEPSYEFLRTALVFGGIPLLLFLVIFALLYGPPLARGESVRPGGQPLESQWLGGPRKAAGELAAPDGEDSKAGGAGGTW